MKSLALLLLSLPALLTAAPGPLRLLVQTDKASYSANDPLRVTLVLSNRSGLPVDIPAIALANAADYFRIHVATPTGVPIFFISRELDPLLGTPTPAFVTLSPGAEFRIQLERNQSGFGFLGYATPGVPNSLRLFTGSFLVSASFTVTAATAPPNPGPNAFIGTVLSTDDDPPVPIGIRRGDATGDGAVNCADVALVRSAFGTRATIPGFVPRADLNQDGRVDVRDLATVTQQLSQGTVCQ
jgi:hypothetical protein